MSFSIPRLPGPPAGRGRVRARAARAVRRRRLPRPVRRPHAADALEEWTFSIYELDGCRIEGSIVIVSPHVTHHDPPFYPEPFALRPARWTEDERRKRPRYAYLPFGGGPRARIGEAFAWAEATLVLATLARQWKLELPSGYEARLEPRVTLRPKNGLPMKAVRRGRGRADGYGSAGG